MQTHNVKASLSRGKVRRIPRISIDYICDKTSHCILCSRYFFGEELKECPHCGASIFEVLSDEALRGLPYIRETIYQCAKDSN